MSQEPPGGLYSGERGGGADPRGNARSAAPPWLSPALGETLGAWPLGPWPA
jgi:hypothetical protein